MKGLAKEYSLSSISKIVLKPPLDMKFDHSLFQIFFDNIFSDARPDQQNCPGQVHET